MSPDFGPPSLTPVARVAEEIETKRAVERVEIWRKLWQRAIVRAVIPHLRVENGVTDSALANVLDRHSDDLLSAIGTPRPISLEFDRIVNENGSLPDLLKFLDHEGWHEIDHAVGVALGERSRPLCYFIDIVQEDSAYAPLYWLWCMKGLLRQILRFIREPLGGDKLRIFVAVREQIWTELGKATPINLEQHPNVRVLRWDSPALLEFLGSKIRSLPDLCRLGDIDPESDPAEVVAAWLGSSTIHNRVRDVDEPMTNYILRHTRLIPRDIVVVGNVLAREVYAVRMRGADQLDPARIHLAIADSARTAGWEELHWCALEIISGWLAAATGSVERGRILPDEDAAGRVARELSSLLKSCTYDVISDEDLDDLEREAQERLGKKVDLKSLLWRHGLIGWGSSQEGPFRFSYGDALPGRDAPPPEESHVAMHPVLIDAVGIVPRNEIPISPFPEEQL